VEIIDVMRAMRRGIVSLGMAPVPDSLRVTMRNLAGSGNPWGEPTEKRTQWAEPLNVSTFSNGAQILYFPCCTTAYDPSVRRVSRATATVFQQSGTSFGILGEREVCCGESARKAGDEELFQRLMQDNMASFQESGATKVVVSSPHCYYTFKNEYPVAENGLEVLHVTQFLAQQIKEGKLKFTKEIKKRVTYHDPCYLGRHSGEFDAPREILSAIPGVELVEMADNRENSFCCGGGGGQVWMETKPGERLGEVRIEQALDVGAEVVALACPYCMLMFEGCVQPDVLERVSLMDITELVAEAM
jgi:Fe-S oxidoreductase